MSSRRWLWAAGLALALNPGARAANELTSQFEWRAPLPASLPSGTLGRIEIPDTVFEKCRRYPGDLRIIDAGGNQWPFYIWTPEKKPELRLLTTRPLNASTVDGPPRYLRQDVHIEPASAEKPLHNQVILATSGKDFIRRVEVLGSEDQTAWARLGEGFLIDYSRDFKADNRVIRYSPSSFPYLQVRVYPDARNALEPFDIIRVDAATADTTPESRMTDLEIAPTAPAMIDAKSGRQILVYDLGTTNRPVEQIVLRVATPEYVRALSVFGRNALDGLWRWVAHGEIHRMGSAEQNALSLKGFAYRYMKIEISNHDDLPLDVENVTAQALPRYLVFESLGGRDPQLYYGSPAVDSPYYDLRRRTQEKEQVATPILELKDARVNTLQTVPFWIAHKKIWIGAAVGLVGLIVLSVIVGMLRRLSEEE